MSVILSIGRHESYCGCRNLPLNNEGLVRAWLSGEIILHLLSKPEMIYSSPLARAVATAELRTAAMGDIAVFVDDLLQENASFMEAQTFLCHLFEKIAHTDVKHVHLVTHAPTATNLNHGDFAPLDTGDIMVWTADDWQEMAYGTHQTGIIRMNEHLNKAKFAEALKMVETYQDTNLEELIAILNQKL